MYNHIKDTIITVIPSIGGLYAALEATNMLIKVLIGGATLVYVIIKAVGAWRDIKRK